MVDAGGGLGTLAGILAASRPDLTVTVLDRPEVIALARAEAAGGPLHWHPGDLFAPWGLAADAVILARVLHDWEDSDALRILGRAREALHPGGQVFVVEMLLPEEGFAGAQCDLHLLAVTGGKERCGAAYQRLLSEAGFTPAGIHRPGALPAVVGGVLP